MNTTNATTDHDRYRQASRILHDVAKPMRVLSALGWDASVRDDFLAGGAQTLPAPDLRADRSDPGARRRRRGQAAAPARQRGRRLARTRSQRDRVDRTHAVVPRHAGVPRVQSPALRRSEAAAAVRSRDTTRVGHADPGPPVRTHGRAPDAAARTVEVGRGGGRRAEGRGRRALRRGRPQDSRRRRAVGERRCVDEPDQDPPRCHVHRQGHRPAAQPRGVHPRGHRA